MATFRRSRINKDALRGSNEVRHSFTALELVKMLRTATNRDYATRRDKMTSASALSESQRHHCPVNFRVVKFLHTMNQLRLLGRIMNHLDVTSTSSCLRPRLRPTSFTNSVPQFRSIGLRNALEVTTVARHCARNSRVSAWVAIHNSSIETPTECKYVLAQQ